MTLTKTLAVIDARDEELGADANVCSPPPKPNFGMSALR